MTLQDLEQFWTNATWAYIFHHLFDFIKSIKPIIESQRTLTDSFQNCAQKLISIRSSSDIQHHGHRRNKANSLLELLIRVYVLANIIENSEDDFLGAHFKEIHHVQDDL